MEDVNRIGTPLDPIAEDEVPSKKPITVADQIAVDSNGRRRFHGAFTGGFSAGYWNTVGSKDGWKPQTFKSSRAEKAAYGQQNPIDFMDDEDTGEFGIAPQRIQTTEDFTRTEEDENVGRKRKRQTVDNSGPIPGVPVLQLLLKSCHDKVTINLLKKMGWKGGQQRPRQKELRVAESEEQQANDEPQQQTDADIATSRVVTCDMGPIKRYASSDDDDSDKDSDSDLSFEADEFDTYTIGIKTDRFGIDYVGLDRSTFGESSSSAGPVERFSLFPTFEMVDNNQKKLSIKGQAFGVGAFEEDDEDIYARDDMGKYDFVLGEKARNEKKGKKKLPAIMGSGEYTLEGFHVMENLTKSMKKVFHIDVPRAFEPRNWIKRKSRFSPMAANVFSNNRDDGKKIGRHDLTPFERGIKLGEAKMIPESIVIPSPGASAASNSSAIIANAPSSKPIEISEGAVAARGSDDKSGKVSLIPLITDRFVSSNSVLTVEEAPAKAEPEVVVPVKEVKVVRTKIIWKPCQLLSHKMNVETIGGSKPDSRPNSFSLFSCLNDGNESTMKKPLQFMKTNDVYAGEENELAKIKQRDRNALLREKERGAINSMARHDTASIPLPPSPAIPSKLPAEILPKRPQPKTEIEKDILKRQNEHPAKKKDIFKAVFDSSSDDDDDDGDAADNDRAANETNNGASSGSIGGEQSVESSAAISKAKATIAMILSQTAEEVNILRNNSPPRGLFAGLVRKPAMPMNVEPQAEKQDDEKARADELPDVGAYGPCLPKLPLVTSSRDAPPKVIFNPSVATKLAKKKAADEWVEKDDIKDKSMKKQKKHKKEKKKKHKKEKHSHKEKKKKK